MKASWHNNKRNKLCNESHLGKDLLVEFLLKNGSNPNLLLYNNERAPLHEAGLFKIYRCSVSMEIFSFYLLFISFFT